MANITEERTVKLSGIKLMEHSWIKNSQMHYVLDKLRNDWYWDRIVWVWDYYEDSEAKEELNVLYSPYEFWSEKEFGWDDNYTSPYSDHEELYIINFDKKEYVNLATYIDRHEHVTWNREWVPHPLSILTACSNNRWGGDYRPGKHEDATDDLVGYWKWDSIWVQSELQYEDYTELNPLFID